MAVPTRASGVTPGELSAVWRFVRMGVAYSAEELADAVLPLVATGLFLRDEEPQPALIRNLLSHLVGRFAIFFAYALRCFFRRMIP